MKEIVQLMEEWQLNVGDLRERMYRAPTPRERWHGLWLLGQGWSAIQVAEALDREPHTIGNWLANFRRGGAQESGAKTFFVDEAHFRADADLRGKWVLKGEPALVDSTSPWWGEKACYYSGVCLEAGEVEAMEIAGNSNAETSTAFFTAAKRKTSWTSGSDLGQWASPPREKRFAAI